MSVGFPHDPFHQIVNVNWTGYLAFRLETAAIMDHESGAVCGGGPSPPLGVLFTWTQEAVYHYLGPDEAFNPLFSDPRPRRWIASTRTWQLITSGVTFSGLPATPFNTVTFSEWQYFLSILFFEWAAIPSSFEEVANIPVPEHSALRFRKTTLAETAFESILEVQSPACYDDGGFLHMGSVATESSGLEFEKRSLQLSAIRATYQNRVYKPHAIQRIPNVDLIPPTGHKSHLWVLCRRTAA